MTIKEMWQLQPAGAVFHCQGSQPNTCTTPGVARSVPSSVSGVLDKILPVNIPCGMCLFIQELPFGVILFGVYISSKIPQTTFIYYFVGVYESFKIHQTTCICWSSQSLVGRQVMQVLIIFKLGLRNLHWICWLAIFQEVAQNYIATI